MKKFKLIGLILLLAVIAVGIYVYPKASMYFYGKKTASIQKETAF